MEGKNFIRCHRSYIVGLAYLDGSGVPVDEGKAFNWLRLAAGQEHVNAMLHKWHKAVERARAWEELGEE